MNDVPDRPDLIHNGPGSETLTQKMTRMELIFILLKLQNKFNQANISIQEILAYGFEYDGDGDNSTPWSRFVDIQSEVEQLLRMLVSYGFQLKDSGEDAYRMMMQSVRDEYQKCSTHSLLHYPMIKAEEFPIHANDAV
jgi:hypothetical protein